MGGPADDKRLLGKTPGSRNPRDWMASPKELMVTAGASDHRRGAGCPTRPAGYHAGLLIHPLVDRSGKAAPPGRYKAHQLGPGEGAAAAVPSEVPVRSDPLPNLPSAAED